MKRHVPGGGWTALVAIALVSIALAACAGTSQTSTSSSTASSPILDTPTTATALTTSTPPALPAALQLLLDSTRSMPDVGTETIEVWICHVPLDTTDQTYNPVPFRLQLTPTNITDTLNQYVSAYFVSLSHGLYRPRFVAGGTYDMTASDSPNVCVSHALSGSATTSNAIFAVADAEHTASAAGGFGIHGSTCNEPTRAQCPASSTGRAAYVGASDFHPDWGPEPAVDLEEHEIGHLLGWPHSGDDSGEGHSSGLDVMSDSAAPRDFDRTSRDAQDTLAINRLTARWLPLVAVAAASPNLATVRTTATRSNTSWETFALQPSFGTSGTRVVILPVDATHMLTVELLAKSGFDFFLPQAGVTITLIDQSPSACGHTDATPCTGADRVQLTKVGTAPFYDMLTAAGQAVTADGWTIELTNIGSDAMIQVARATTAG